MSFFFKKKLHYDQYNICTLFILFLLRDCGENIFPTFNSGLLEGNFGKCRTKVLEL